jgi:hypothetical protein
LPGTGGWEGVARPNVVCEHTRWLRPLRLGPPYRVLSPLLLGLLRPPLLASPPRDQEGEGFANELSKCSGRASTGITLAGAVQPQFGVVIDDGIRLISAEDYLKFRMLPAIAIERGDPYLRISIQLGARRYPLHHNARFDMRCDRSSCVDPCCGSLRGFSGEPAAL